MKRSTIKLLLVAAVVYYGLLYSIGGFLPQNLAPQLYFLVAPLFVLVLIIVGDLSARTTVPSHSRRLQLPSRRIAREVAQLTRLIEVGTWASPDYFENVLMTRLRDLLVEKARLETGLGREKVLEILENPRLGPRFLANDLLYRLLYSPGPAKGTARIEMLEEAVALVEAWKP